MTLHAAGLRFQILTRSPMHVWLGVLAVIALVFIAYAPAMNAGFIWDDDSYVTDNRLLHDLHGLYRIWIPGQARHERTPQYYPAVFTMFWFEYQLWELHPRGYHVINVILHALNAMLVWRLCVRIGIPAGWLIAMMFALHPVHVESVAWITERKNVLSGFFYLCAAICYLRFDSGRPPAEPGANGLKSGRWYAAALLLFVLALLSKTVTCSLPAALILIMLYQRKPLTFKRLLPLAPMFIIGLALALNTANVERAHVGATGDEFMFSVLDRILIASHALLFYPYKLLWPWPVMFIYPRWELDATSITTYWPAAVVLMIAATAMVAFIRGWRGPAVALAFYAGTIFPALGFVNIYPMRFSFVADHFQYLASLGIITFIVAALVVLLRTPVRITIAAAIVLPILATLTFVQSATYHTAETVYRDTLSKNNNAWMPHNNLGNIVLHRDPVEAEAHYREALRIKPDHYTARSNLAEALRLQQRYEEAIDECYKAIATMQATLDEKQIRQRPAFFATDYYRLGTLHQELGQIAEAEAAYREAVSIAPLATMAHLSLAQMLIQQDRPEEASVPLLAALKVNPRDWASLRALAIVRAQQQQFAESMKLYGDALQSATSVDQQLQTLPAYIRLLATCPEEDLRDLSRSIALAKQMCEITNWNEPFAMDILAGLYAEADQTADAIRVGDLAVAVAQRQGQIELASQIRERTQNYRRDDEQGP